MALLVLTTRPLLSPASPPGLSEIRNKQPRGGPTRIVVRSGRAATPNPKTPVRPPVLRGSLYKDPEVLYIDPEVLYIDPEVLYIDPVKIIITARGHGPGLGTGRQNLGQRPERRCRQAKGVWGC